MESATSNSTPNNILAKPLGTKARHTKKRRSKARLWLEITILVIIKVCILLVIKKLWFSEPIAKKMQVPQQKIEQKLLGATHQQLPSSITNIPNVYPIDQSARQS